MPIRPATTRRRPPPRPPAPNNAPGKALNVDERIEQTRRNATKLSRQLDRNPWSRRFGLTALGLAPFLLFVLLLPPADADRPATSANTLPNSGQSVTLSFPFSQSASTAIEPETPESPRTLNDAPAVPAVPAGVEAPSVAVPSPPAPAPESAPAAQSEVPAVPVPTCSTGEGGADMSYPGCRGPAPLDDPDDTDDSVPAEPDLLDDLILDEVPS